MRRAAVALLLAGCADAAPPLVRTPPAETCRASCVDNDPCTDEVCTGDGACLHVARNAELACLNDTHCDDGDACTDGVCELDDCGLMRCRMLSRPECEPCVSGCEEVDPMCNWVTALPPSGAVRVQDAGFMKQVVGVAAVDAADCSAGVCVCEGGLAFVDGAASLGLIPGPDLDRPWGCAIDTCGDAGAMCGPLMPGVGYVVWGPLRFAGGGPKVEVEGYCLSARVDHLPGRYAATFVAGSRASFELELESDGGLGVRGRMETCLGCAAAGLLEEQLLTFSSGPQKLELELGFVGTSTHVTLVPQEQVFTGNVRDAADSVLGKLTLVRLAP